MNIPDEVLWEQFQTVYEPGSRTSFEYAQRDQPDVLDGIHAVAEWARKEALREAAEVAKAWGRANEEGGYARSAFTVARKIRALADGDAS